MTSALSAIKMNNKALSTNVLLSMEYVSTKNSVHLPPMDKMATFSFGIKILRADSRIQNQLHGL